MGKSGRKDECLAYLREVWTDMRPLSLRQQMAAAAQQKAHASAGRARGGAVMPKLKTTGARLRKKLKGVTAGEGP